MLFNETLALLLIEMQQSSLMELGFLNTRANCWHAHAAHACTRLQLLFSGQWGLTARAGAKLPHMLWN